MKWSICPWRVMDTSRSQAEWSDLHPVFRRDLCDQSLLSRTSLVTKISMGKCTA